MCINNYVPSACNLHVAVRNLDCTAHSVTYRDGCVLCICSV